MWLCDCVTSLACAMSRAMYVSRKSRDGGDVEIIVAAVLVAVLHVLVNVCNSGLELICV